MHLLDTPPDPGRPQLRKWRLDRRISKVDAADALKISVVQVDRYELPFDSERRQIPRAEVLERIFEWTNGAVTPADFYPPHLARTAEQVTS